MVALKEDLKLALDPVVLAREYLKNEPDEWQKVALRSDHPRQAYNCSRQAGKSTVAAVLAAHTALYRPGSLTLMVSRTLDHSGELFRKAVAAYHAVGRPVPAQNETQLTLALRNSSRIVSRPGRDDAAVRSYTADLLIVDEAARVPNALYASARPILAVSGGRLVTLSTPFGTRGWWYEAWRSEEPWERYEVPADKVPRIPPEFLEEERRTLGEWWFKQEYGCEFLDAITQAFTRDEVDRAFAEEVQTWAL